MWPFQLHALGSSRILDQDDNAINYTAFKDGEIEIINNEGVTNNLDKVSYIENTRGISVSEVLIKTNSNEVMIHGRLSTGNLYQYALADEGIAHRIGKQVILSNYVIVAFDIRVHLCYRRGTDG